MHARKAGEPVDHEHANAADRATSSSSSRSNKDIVGGQDVLLSIIVVMRIGLCRVDGRLAAQQRLDALGPPYKVTDKL